MKKALGEIKGTRFNINKVSSSNWVPFRLQSILIQIGSQIRLLQRTVQTILAVFSLDQFRLSHIIDPSERLPSGQVIATDGSTIQSGPMMQ